MKQTAVVLFTGDVRREERRKNLPRRFLAALHASVAGGVASLDGCDLFVRGDDRGLPNVCERFDARGPVSDQVSEIVALLFERGYARVVLLAGDVCRFAPKLLADSIATLKDTAPRAVIGRSGDGGFYLAGFNRRPDIAWHALPWFQPTIAERLEEELQVHGFELTRAPDVDDIDARDDAERLLAQPGLIARCLRAVLRSLLTAVTITRTPELLRPLLLIAPPYRRPPPRPR